MTIRIPSASVRVWSLQHLCCTRVLCGHSGYVTGVRIIIDEQGDCGIITTSADGRCSVWGVEAHLASPAWPVIKPLLEEESNENSEQV